jgi:hypothetical protein
MTIEYQDTRSTQIFRLDVGTLEQHAGQRTERLVEATEALLRDGVMILGQAVDSSILDRLDARMSADLETLLRRPERAENFAAGHLQQDPPPEIELMPGEVMANRWALEICRRAMRQAVSLNRYTNNTNMAGSEIQTLHVDEGQLWPGLPLPHAPARLTVNIPLSSTGVGHGATEVWLGTHLDTRIRQSAPTPAEGAQRALTYLLAARRANLRPRVDRRVGLAVPDVVAAQQGEVRPPVHVETRVGDVIIRDPRMWHRGTANHSGRTRFMLALTYDPMWRKPDASLTLPSQSRELFERADLSTSATFVEGPIDYLDRYLPSPTGTPPTRTMVQP